MRIVRCVIMRLHVRLLMRVVCAVHILVFHLVNPGVCTLLARCYPAFPFYVEKQISNKQPPIAALILPTKYVAVHP
jgi:hypothetical protein